MGDLYVALIHHPVLDKNGAVVTTAVTNMDVHDIARMARTFGVRRYYVCTPVPTLQRLVERIILHWEEGPGATYNETPSLFETGRSYNAPSSMRKSCGCCRSCSAVPPNASPVCSRSG